MKIFAVSADFELSPKVPWLDAFRATYDDPYRYHITLKHQTCIEEKDITEMRQIVSAVAQQYKPFSLVFDTYAYSKTPSGYVIMVMALQSPELIALQKQLREQLSKFGVHKKPYYTDFETNFRPHITIARKLTEEMLVQAKAELQNPINCNALINEITLTVVENDTMEETTDSNNMEHFKLGARVIS